nr:MAG TPA: hypothetical protein [Caudoviricetes sp.]
MNTNYFLNLVAKNVYTIANAPALPKKLYLGLSSTAPNADGENVTEPTGGNYARVELKNLGEPTNGVIKNTGTLSFPRSSSAWGQVTHYTVYDALVNGNLLQYGELEEATSIVKNANLIFEPNTITLSVAN